MNSWTRIAVWSVVAASVSFGALAALAHSELFAIIAAACATLVVVVGFSANAEHSGTSGASAVQLGYDATTSATVDILDLPRPAMMASTVGTVA